MDITELLAFSEKQGASDLHLSAGLPPMIRVDGDIRRINLPALDHKEVHSLVYEIMNDKRAKTMKNSLRLTFLSKYRGLLDSVLMHSIIIEVQAVCFGPFLPRC